ncbi:MAG: metallophosphoesterase [Nanoarchaeota archaeon]|mgnify:CR=1 FL=1
MENKPQRKKTRIMAVGDIHGDKKMTQRLADKAVKEKVDLVILAGDLTLFESSIEGIVGPFVKANKPVFLIPGNHETLATANVLAELYPNTKNIHGYAVKINDIGIFGAGGANIGLHQLSEKEIYRLLMQGYNQIKGINKKIMVTHMHPEGTIIEKMSSFVPASKAVRKAIEKFQPDFAIHGHIHEAAGLEDKIGKTRVINVARKEKIFEI